MYLVISGVFIHLVLLMSIFDIYFKSPIINDVTSCISKGKAPAKRLVLLIADGLRAESLMKSKETAYNDMKTVAPYLSWITTTQATWGISHTRVPTESRPGHVALAAGFYEDPSAVAKGWKENTVEFDSIFNQSTYSWAWGSPDIVTMFAKGTSKDHVFIDTYDSQNEDFSGQKSTTLLDTWVFDKVELFLKNMRADDELKKKVENDKIIFFLHLLGLDTAGHTHKPNSPEYMDNIAVVDVGIKKTYELFESYFNDEKTAYIFTADHGMTDWGSHGAGSTSETETPFVAWGAGIKRGTGPIDIKQADIAPLVSTLIGIPIPVNSVGVLPIEYLNMNHQEIANAILANACQMSTQFNEKRYRTEKDTWKMLHKPFTKLNEETIHKLDTEINKAINIDKNYQKAIELSSHLINISKEGLDYYQNYYQNMLLICTTMSYVGWIILLFINILRKPDASTLFKSRTFIQSILIEYTNYKMLHLTFATIAVVVLFLICTQNFPVMYYLHCLLPIGIWWCVAINCRFWSTSVLDEWKHKEKKIEFIFWAAFYFLGIETLVFCFFERRILTISLIGISVWPLFAERRKISTLYKVSWMVTCFGLSIFTMLAVIGSYYNSIIVVLAGIVWVGLGTFLLKVPNLIAKDALTIDHKYKYIIYILNSVLIFATLNVYVIERSLSDKEGLPLLNQICSWFILIVSFILPMYGSFYIASRLLNIKLALAIPVILLSVNYEPIFILIFFTNLFMWLLLEHQLSRRHFIKLTDIHFVDKKVNKQVNPEEGNIQPNTAVQLADFRRAYFFLLYILLAFFGTGNIASLNSFDPTWVRNFLTVFSPFTMAALIIIKIVIPFLAVSCTFRAITVAVKVPIRKLFLIVLMLGDIMGLQFLYFVKNQGSWLEIGTSISHFVIVQIIVVFLIIFYYLAIALTELSFSYLK